MIDTPKGASYYGAAVSAPVFAEVAQQVLEYLGVPHDIDIATRSPPPKRQARTKTTRTRHQRSLRGRQRPAR